MSSADTSGTCGMSVSITETCTCCVGAAAVPDAGLGVTYIAVSDAGRTLVETRSVATVIFFALGCAFADFSLGSLPFV